jgi:type I restriction enzyme S subunit
MTRPLSPGWRRVRLSEVLQQVYRLEELLPDKDYRPLGVKWYANGVFERERKRGKAIAAKQLNRVEAGDFIYNRLFAWKGSFAVVQKEHDGGHVSGEFPIFRAKDGALSEDYLFLYFSRPLLWKRIEYQSTGTTNVSRNRFREDQFLSLSINLPPLSEQRRIVSAVRTVDEAIQTNETLLRVKESTGRLLIDELIRSGLRGKDGAPWLCRPLASVATIQTGIAKNKNRAAHEGNDVPYLRVANVQDGRLDLREVKTIRIRADEVERYRLKIGDVLLTEGGDNDKLGRGLVWRGEIPLCLHQNHIFAVQCKTEELLPEFLTVFCSSTIGRAYFLGAAKQTTNLASINARQLKEMPVAIPPRPIQHQIAHIANTLTEQLESCREVGARMKHSRNVLLENTLDGRTR